jgi:hypothetical protein
MTRSDLMKLIVAAVRRNFPAAPQDATERLAEELVDVFAAAGPMGETRRVKIVYDPKADLAWSARDIDTNELMLWHADRSTLLRDCRERGWTVIDQESAWKSE